MSRALSGLMIPLLCVGCAAVNPAASTATNAEPVVMTPQCSDHTTAAIVDGVREGASGRLCRRAEGALVVTEDVAGEPAVSSLYWPAYTGAAIADWGWGPPVVFAGGIFFGGHNHFRRFRHFRHFRRFHRFRHFHRFRRFPRFGHHRDFHRFSDPRRAMTGGVGHRFNGHARW